MAVFQQTVFKGTELCISNHFQVSETYPSLLDFLQPFKNEETILGSLAIEKKQTKTGNKMDLASKLWFADLWFNHF